MSIDRTIQDIADAALRESIETNVAVAGTVVVLDVKTGRVLAIATAPNYDSNKPGDAEQTQARNRAVTDAFEIGSVMKLFTIAAALDSGITTPHERYFVKNGWKVGSKHFRDTHEDGILTTSEIIKRSSNVGTIQIALRLGALGLFDALARYGFGTPTGIELPGERAGTLRHGKTWRDIELATMSFGYGLQVTPLQLAAAVAAIGNDGVYQAPRIVADVADAFGRSIYTPDAQPRRVMKAETATAVREMMRSVYEGGELPGTAAKAPVPGFVCGGKTGTARKLDVKTKGYGVKKYYASFAGLAPIESPTLAIVVLIDEPTGKNIYGGSVAAPVFARVASEALTYLGVAGTPTPAPSAPGSSEGAAAVVTVSPAIDANEEGADVDGLLGLPADLGLALDGAELYRDDLQQVPSLIGLSMPAALELAAERGLELAVTGSGIVVGQQAQWQDGRLVVHVHFADGREFVRHETTSRDVGPALRRLGGRGAAARARCP
ncbi:MAG: hypothetical protein IPL79_18750 [Myxococcales bacterium]|nr:hypothetical protein [Myxococcales bacterium]